MFPVIVVCFTSTLALSGRLGLAKWQSAPVEMSSSPLTEVRNSIPSTSSRILESVKQVLIMTNRQGPPPSPAAENPSPLPRSNLSSPSCLLSFNLHLPTLLLWFLLALRPPPESVPRPRSGHYHTFPPVNTRGRLLSLRLER